MTTFAEWQLLNENIFEALALNWDAEYLEETTPETMQFYFLSKYGQRKIRSMFTAETAESIAGHLNHIFGKKWERDYQLFIQTMEMEFDAQARAEDESTSMIDRETNTNQTNKTSGFNVGGMVDNDASDISGNDSTSQEARNVHSNTTVSRAGLMEQYSFNLRHNLLERILLDISTLIVLPIY